MALAGQWSGQATTVLNMRRSLVRSESVRQSEEVGAAHQMVPAERPAGRQLRQLALLGTGAAVRVAVVGRLQLVAVR